MQMSREMLLSRVFRAYQDLGERVEEEVFDLSALLAVHKLINSGSLSYLNGVIGAGKESRVYWGVSGKRDVAVKIYFTKTSKFRRRIDYVVGDPRFERYSKSPGKIIYTWARKEYSNLLAAHSAGIPVPEPIGLCRNILVMDFVGRDGIPSSTLRGRGGNESDYKKVLSLIRSLFQKAKLVHADLSEFNIFKAGRKVIFFDFGSAVEISHPMAIEFLRRDVESINRFFAKKGVEVLALEEVLRRVKGDEL